MRQGKDRPATSGRLTIWPLKENWKPSDLEQVHAPGLCCCSSATLRVSASSLPITTHLPKAGATFGKADAAPLLRIRKVCEHIPGSQHGAQGTPSPLGPSPLVKHSRPCFPECTHLPLSNFHSEPSTWTLFSPSQHPDSLSLPPTLSLCTGHMGTFPLHPALTTGQGPICQPVPV